MKAFAWRRTALWMSLMMIAAVPVMAALVSTNASAPIPSINNFGSPTLDNAGVGSGKVYKEDVTGIVVGVFTGTVQNASGTSTVLQNQGYSFVDPWTNESNTATADVQVVSQPILSRSQAVLVFAYSPFSIPQP